MLGPLIHNSRVLETLKERGIRILNEGEPFEETLKAIPSNSSVIIRAHGLSPIVENLLRQQGLEILDATCPHVKASQNSARHFAERGYRIFIAGEKDHAEISGILGCVEAAFVAASPAEAEKAAAELYRQEPLARTVLIAQTTISLEEYSLIEKAIKKYFPELEVLNTICGATGERQEALRQLSAQVDALLVVGDRGSANTRRLLSLAQSEGKPAWLVEKLEDIPAEIKKYKTVGLSAGASTPDDLIDEVEKALR